MNQRKNILRAWPWLLMQAALFAWLAPQQALADDSYVESVGNYSIMLTGSNVVTIEAPACDFKGTDTWVSDGNVYVEWKDGSTTKKETVLYWAGKDVPWDGWSNSDTEDPFYFKTETEGYLDIKPGDTNTTLKLTKDDMMAVFINGELRGLATQPAVIVGDEQATSHLFVMRAYGNETGTVKISLSYYCKKLTHIFTLTQDLDLTSDESLGTDEDFIPPFTLGSAKYPVTKTVVAEQYLMLADITPIEGNLLGAFVGNECRGHVTLSELGSTRLVIYGRNAGESVTLKYYDAISGLLFTIPDAVKL